MFNILLQVLEDGMLTDSLKRKVSFKNCVLIMTSNLGARRLRGRGGLGFTRQDDLATYDTMKNTVMEEVRKIFNPEFLNRLDELIVFRSLNETDMEQIVHILLGQVQGRLKDSDLSLSLTSGAIELLLEKGFDPDLGARPMRRAIQRLIEDPLADAVLRGRFKAGSTIRATKKGDVLGFEDDRRAQAEDVREEPAAGEVADDEAEGTPVPAVGGEDEGTEAPPKEDSPAE